MSDAQAAVIDWLMQPSAHGGQAVERIDTHISVVFLAGSRVLKLKRAVRFDYLDFSTLERRRTACEAELRVNQRTAPTLYRRVVPVTRESDGRIALDGAGTPVEWVVEMARFDQDALFDRLAQRGMLDLSLMDPLAAAVARLHASADTRPDHGGRAGMTWVVRGNTESFRSFPDLLAPARCDALDTASRAEIDRHAARLEARRQAGFVRQCHGDLHLRNIVLLDGSPTLFDAIEFNDDIACIDVMYDVAFLVMDLWRRQLPLHANRVLNAYLSETRDLDALPLLPLFLSCRAAVRAKTSATAAGIQADAGRVRELRSLATSYLDMALACLEPAAPRVLAVGGVSGTGKSTLARTLAPALGRVPGAVVLRSDEIRKALTGVAPTARLDPSAYTEAMNARVYETMAERTAAILGTGHSVVLDAVHGHAAERAAAQAVATRAGAAFAGLWLDAPDELLLARVAERRADASDADAAVVRLQRAAGIDLPAAADGESAWHRLDASADPETVAGRAWTVLSRTQQQDHQQRGLR